MNIVETNLKPHNTFGIQAQCKGIIRLYSEQDIFEFLLRQDSQYLVLGGGSNVLFRSDYDGFILKNEIKGIEIIDEDEKALLVKVGAGEIWHSLVMWSVGHNLWGLENLALIPGSVGAAPIQNIGAYGVEQNKCFHSLNAIDLEQGTTRTFYNEECNFGYRDSIFKQAEKGKFLITHVCYLLSKIPNPVLSYGDVASEVGSSTDRSEVIAEAVIRIRKNKLPNPAEIGNSGSFFKNPIISKEEFEPLQALYPGIAFYAAGAQVKLAAAWLIDQCGFKGIVDGNTGTYKKQALVIVNHGAATGKEIFAFAQKIQQAVKDRFGVVLEMEVNVV
ncbi:MAG: UDP-N-acetylmuramate dehydrogenase [Saprospiraceae bacterium]|nr:UDP-N-acetylmuramate dehydrogenase [Saprospiraceae bacterium]